MQQNEVECQLAYLSPLNGGFFFVRQIRLWWRLRQNKLIGTLLPVSISFRRFLGCSRYSSTAQYFRHPFSSPKNVLPCTIRRFALTYHICCVRHLVLFLKFAVQVASNGISKLEFQISTMCDNL